MARGWSPRGGNSEVSRNTDALRRRDGVRHEILAPGIDPRMRVRVGEHGRREHELGMHRFAEESHAHVVGGAISLLAVAAKAGRDDVNPRRLAAARPRHDVVRGETLAAAVTVLAGVAVPSQDVL